MKQAVKMMLTTIALMAVAATAFAEVQLMSIDQLAKEIGQDNLLIVDVRSDRDWKPSDRKITSAKRMAPNDTGWIQKEPKGRRIVLYCA